MVVGRILGMMEIFSIIALAVHYKGWNTFSSGWLTIVYICAIIPILFLIWSFIANRNTGR